MSTPRILIVEDEAVVAMDIESRLRFLGYEVAGLETSGEHAVARAAETRPDLVLMDIGLQGEMDGITAARLLHDRWRLPVVFLSAYAEDATLEQAKLAEPFGYLLKPFEDRELKTTLEMALYKHQAEEKIRQFNVELEQRVRDRTAQLEATNRELEAFSYSVSHDLRAPLRAIKGFSSILQENHASELSPPAQRLLSLVCENTRKMDRLIDDLLSFARLSRQPIRKQTVAITELARSVVEELRAEQAGRRVDLQLDNLPPCQADSSLLRQVLMNLLSNALKYTRQRETAVIKIGCQEQPGGEPIYFVRDNGAGFDMRYASQLFGVFQRLHREDEFEGNGVGLAIAQRILCRHGGRIWAEAKVNEGATFFFTVGKPGTGDREPNHIRVPESA